MPDDQAQIRGLLADVTAGYRAKDAGQIVASYAPDIVMVAGGDVAYAHGLARMGPAGVFSMWLRVTFGLRKTGGRWQIAHLHGSVPFYMDQTFKAAVDLQP